MADKEPCFFDVSQFLTHIRAHSTFLLNDNFSENLDEFCSDQNLFV